MDRRAMDNRREFLLRVARGVAYAAPVIRTLAAPAGLAAQASGKGMGMGMGMGMLIVARPKKTGTGILPPWSTKPPGS